MSTTSPHRKSLAEIGPYLDQSTVSLSVNVLLSLRDAHRSYGESLYDVYKTSAEQSSSSGVATIDLEFLFNAYDATTRTLYRGVQDQLATTAGYTERDRQLLGWMVEELKGMTLEGMRKKDEEGEAEHQEKLRAEERYGILQALGLRGLRKSVRYPGQDLVL